MRPWVEKKLLFLFNCGDYIRDNSRNLSVRMTEEQYRRLQRYMELTKLKSTAYFCRLIQGNDFKGRSPISVKVIEQEH